MTWAYCQICQASQEKGWLSEQAWKMSWAKFLEVNFYPDPDRTPLPGCPHDYVRNHVRLFIKGNVTIRIHNEAVDNFEVVLPSTRPYVRSETKLVLKNDEITACYTKAMKFWDSVGARLKSFDVDVVDPAKLNKLRLALADLLDKMEEDRRTFIFSLADAAKNVSIYLCSFSSRNRLLISLTLPVRDDGRARSQPSLRASPGQCKSYQ